MKLRLAAICGLAVVCSGRAFAQEKVQLLYKGQKGQVMTYKSEGNLALEIAGMKLTIELKTLYRDTITEVAANGDLTRERAIDEAEAVVNGQKSPAPESVLKRKEIIVRKPDGTVVSMKTEGGGADDEENKVQNRVSQAERFIFPAKPVGVGDKWSHEYKEDSALHTVAGVADYELVAFEKIQTVDTVKIKLNYRETAGERKLTMSGEAWLEKSSGDFVRAEFKVDNLAFGPPGAPPASGTLRLERTAGAPLPAAGQTGASAPPKKDKTIEDVVKDYEKLEGLFTLYKKKETGRDTIYLEIKESQLNKLLLLQVTASTGVGSFFLAAGDPLDDILFKFVRRDEQVLFVVPNLNFTVDEKKPIARAVKRSFADAYLEAFKVEAKSDERKSVLINVTELFRSDIAQFTQRLMLAAGGMYNIDKEKTAYNTIKVFPTNLYIQTAYNLSRSMGGPPGLGGLGDLLGFPTGSRLADPRSIPLTVNYNLSFLPENNGYRPRLADPRVGYFTTDVDDLTEPREEQTKRYILRWHVEKADPKTTLSPPKEPIVFWLDNAIPEEYREAVRKGLLLWNAPFEQVGIKDAIVVKQMPDLADFDHADMRYNVIRWVASPDNGYAIALFRVNPLTGQILNASITVDSSMTRFTKIEFQRMVDPLSALQENPVEGFSRFRCTYGKEALPQAWLGMVAMNFLAGPGGTMVSEKKYIDAFLTEIVAHEMGHIMGLRHNFIASAQHSMKELSNGDLMRKEGVVASVMDYTPFNVMALHSRNNEYYTTTLGLYDRWAIEYGYTALAAGTPEGEKEGLRLIARRTNEPGHWYHSDEVADSFDPLVTRFDLGKEPLDYWAVMFNDVRLLMAKLPQRIPERGENYWQFTRHFNGLLGQQARAAMIVSRYLGGLRITGNHRGDPGEKPPLVPVSGADQRRALSLLEKNIFAKQAFNLPKEVLLKLGPNPYPDMMSAILGGVRMDAPVRDLISSIQRATLARLFNAQTLNRIANNEFKTNDTLGLLPLFSVIANAVWEEARTGAPVDGLRRQLQRAHLTTLTDMVTHPVPGTPDDAKMLARHHLKLLKSRLLAAKARDEYTRVHYAEAIDQINKALDAKVLLGTPAAMGGITPRR